MIAQHLLPALKHKRVAEVSFSDIDRLHRTLSGNGTPYRANRVLALLSKMFSLSIRWGWRSDNPAKGVERNQEVKRNRYIAAGELERLVPALAAHADKQAANIVRLLLLTGARSAEARGARWDQMDLVAGIWTKPGATTKQKTEHRVPLSRAARQLLAEIRQEQKPEERFVLPAQTGGHRIDIRRAWREICKAADIDRARVHDLRHSYASILVSSGLSLPIIGALLGHTQPQTTARYSHLFDDPLREATERVGAIFTSTTRLP